MQQAARPRSKHFGCQGARSVAVSIAQTTRSILSPRGRSGAARPDTSATTVPKDRPRTAIAARTSQAKASPASSQSERERRGAHAASVIGANGLRQEPTDRQASEKGASIVIQDRFVRPSAFRPIPRQPSKPFQVEKPRRKG